MYSLGRCPHRGGVHISRKAQVSIAVMQWRFGSPTDGKAPISLCQILNEIDGKERIGFMMVFVVSNNTYITGTKRETNHLIWYFTKRDMHSITSYFAMTSIVSANTMNYHDYHLLSHYDLKK